MADQLRSGTRRDGRCAWCRTSFRLWGLKATLNRQAEGMFDRMNGIGAHEVIIETPDHNASLATLPPKRIEDVLWTFRDRILDLKKDRRFKYILLFKNHGEARGSVAGACALATDRAADSADQRDAGTGRREAVLPV